MTSLRTILAAGAVSLLALGSARAADMPAVPLPAAPVPVGDVGTGWYLRGDVAYSWNEIGRASADSAFVSPNGNTWNAGGVIGGGIGVKMYQLRFDATVDGAPGTTFQGSSLRPGDVTGSLARATALFNGYLDIASWHGLTPYVGAGVGASYLTVSNYASTAVPPFSPPASNSRWNTAWAVMAGLSYPVSPNIMVDVGYRYLHLGYAETGADALGGLSLVNLSSQEIRIGARWNCNDLIPTP